MRAALLMCLGGALALAPSPIRRHVRPLRMAEPAAESVTPGAQQMLDFWLPWAESRQKEFEMPELLARFAYLVTASGSEDQANVWVKRFPLILCMEESRVKDSST